MLEIEHPLDAKLMGNHPKPGTPEDVLQWHVHFSVFAKRGKAFLDFPITFAVDAHREIVALPQGHPRHGARGHEDRRRSSRWSGMDEAVYCLDGRGASLHLGTGGEVKLASRHFP